LILFAFDAGLIVISAQACFKWGSFFYLLSGEDREK